MYKDNVVINRSVNEKKAHFDKIRKSLFLLAVTTLFMSLGLGLLNDGFLIYFHSEKISIATSVNDLLIPLLFMVRLFAGTGAITFAVVMSVKALITLKKESSGFTVCIVFYILDTLLSFLGPIKKYSRTIGSKFGNFGHFGEAVYTWACYLIPIVYFLLLYHEIKHLLIENRLDDENQKLKVYFIGWMIGVVGHLLYILLSLPLDLISRLDESQLICPFILAFILAFACVGSLLQFVMAFLYIRYAAGLIPTDCEENEPPAAENSHNTESFRLGMRFIAVGVSLAVLEEYILPYIHDFFRDGHTYHTLPIPYFYRYMILLSCSVLGIVFMVLGTVIIAKKHKVYQIGCELYLFLMIPHIFDILNEIIANVANHFSYCDGALFVCIMVLINEMMKCEKRKKDGQVKALRLFEKVFVASYAYNLLIYYWIIGQPKSFLNVFPVKNVLNGLSIVLEVVIIFMVNIIFPKIRQDSEARRPE